MTLGPADDGSVLDEVARTRVSRRKLLKGVGAGAAIAWTAPIITSLGAPAFAQGSALCAPGCDCFCGGAQVCGSDANGDCLCGITTEKQCFCGSDISCGGNGFCSSSKECPPGNACVIICCTGCAGPPQGGCLPACGQARKAKAQKRSSSRK